MNSVSDSAVIGSNVKIGSFTVIDDDAAVGDGCVIGSNVVIHRGSVIGSDVRIDDNTVIGKEPLRAVNSIFKNDMEYRPCRIGNGVLIGTGAVIYQGCEIGDNVLIADLATVRENVRIGSETIKGRGAAIENYTTIGRKCKIETNVYLTAYSTVEDFVFIAPGVVTSNDNYAGRTEERFKHFNGVTVRKGGRIGAQATILPGKTINEDGFAAAGSVVTKDVEEKKIVAGNPARVLRDVDDAQLLKNQK